MKPKHCPTLTQIANNSSAAAANSAKWLQAHVSDEHLRQRWEKIVVLGVRP